MTTVEDVAVDLSRPVADVLEACEALGIVASGPRSGLSADEHRRLRAELGGGDDLPPVPAGSHERDPDRVAVTRRPSFRERHDALLAEQETPKRRWNIATATRVAVGAFLLVAVGVGIVALTDRLDDEAISVLGYDADDVGSCYDVDETGGALLTEVDCDVAHDAQLIGVLPVEEDSAGTDDTAEDPGTTTTVPFPGEQLLIDQAETACEDAFVDHVGVPLAETGLRIAFLVPTPQTWEAGDRAILCLAEDPDGPLTAPVTERG